MVSRRFSLKPIHWNLAIETMICQMYGNDTVRYTWMITREISQEISRVSTRHLELGFIKRYQWRCENLGWQECGRWSFKSFVSCEFPTLAAGAYWVITPDVLAKHVPHGIVKQGTSNSKRLYDVFPMKTAVSWGNALFSNKPLNHIGPL
jgi:hypothetical protein